jgi:hypothetical protein
LKEKKNIISNFSDLNLLLVYNVSNIEFNNFFLKEKKNIISNFSELNLLLVYNVTKN